MKVRNIWNGRVIEDMSKDPEYMAHANEIFKNEILPYLLSDPERAQRTLRVVSVEE